MVPWAQTERRRVEGLTKNEPRTGVAPAVRQANGLAGPAELVEHESPSFRSHSVGLSHLSIGKQDTVLDVGCGGGATIARLAAIASEGKIYGVDHSEDSVAASRRLNKRWIGVGRVGLARLRLGPSPPRWYVRSGYGGRDSLLLAQLEGGRAGDFCAFSSPAPRSCSSPRPTKGASTMGS
jgi:SAM-dependent methyltransferase